MNGTDRLMVANAIIDYLRTLGLSIDQVKIRKVALEAKPKPCYGCTFVHNNGMCGFTEENPFEMVKRLQQFLEAFPSGAWGQFMVNDIKIEGMMGPFTSTEPLQNYFMAKLCR